MSLNNYSCYPRDAKNQQVSLLLCLKENNLDREPANNPFKYLINSHWGLTVLGVLLNLLPAEILLLPVREAM